jgi:cobyrinic acid a,c-diamide synthase
VINAAEEHMPHVDALYIGGGFPETNAFMLSENRTFLASLKEGIEGGLPVYAECGGLMYLGESIEFHGKVYPMAGILPLHFSMETSPVAHGYTMIEVVDENPYFKKGVQWKGHEFHYSRVVETSPDLKFVFKMKRGKGIKEYHDGIVYRNLLATYSHLHVLSCPEWAEGMIVAAKKFRSERDAL